MPLIKLNFTPVLLLLLSCSVWHISNSLPVMGKGHMTDSCVLQARMLLNNITNVLAQKDLFSGIDCSKQNMELNRETNTPSVCAPQESTCSGITQPKSTFDQESCLTNIGKDLTYFYRFLVAQPDPQRLLPTAALKELMEDCFKWSLPANLEAAADRSSTFDERLSLCKVLKGFQVRTITINRAIAYINSGEHTK